MPRFVILAIAVQISWQLARYSHHDVKFPVQSMQKAWRHYLDRQMCLGKISALFISSAGRMAPAVHDTVQHPAVKMKSLTNLMRQRAPVVRRSCVILRMPRDLCDFVATESSGRTNASPGPPVHTDATALDRGRRHCVRARPSGAAFLRSHAPSIDVIHHPAVEAANTSHSIPDPMPAVNADLYLVILSFSHPQLRVGGLLRLDTCSCAHMRRTHRRVMNS